MTGPAGSPPGFLARSIHGRDDALAALSATLDPASAGGALALVGEAGMGKSRLARWAAEQAVAGGWVVVEGRAVLELTEALGVLCDAVRAARRAGLTPRNADPVAAGFPATILPELGGGALAPESLGAVFEGAALYLRGLAARRGLLLILEDLHWADPTSLRLVSFLARALTPARAIMLMTYRPDDPAAAPALQEMRRELRRTRLAEEIALEPLTPGESADMLLEILGSRPPAAIETEIVRLAGGSPFALEELTRAAADSGWLDDAETHPGAPLALPFTLTESIRARAGRLDEDARELLRWGAVVGERFDARLLGAVADLSEGETLSRLERCIAAGLVAEDPADASGYGFAFRHALVREALSQEGLTARRRLRHARVLEVGEALAGEGVPISAAELAGHALAAGDRRRTVALSQEAARRALQLGAVEEAVAHLEQALALWPEDGSRSERAEILRETGRLRLRGSRGDEKAMAPLEEALAEFRALGEDGSAAWTLALLAAAHFEAGRRGRGARRMGARREGPASGAGGPAALRAGGLRAGPGAQQAARGVGRGGRRGTRPGPVRRDGGGGARPGEPPRHARDGRDLPGRPGGPGPGGGGARPGDGVPRRRRRGPRAPHPRRVLLRRHRRGNPSPGERSGARRAARAHRSRGVLRGALGLRACRGRRLGCGRAPHRRRRGARGRLGARGVDAVDRPVRLRAGRAGPRRAGGRARGLRRADDELAVPPEPEPRHRGRAPRAAESSCCWGDPRRPSPRSSRSSPPWSPSPRATGRRRRSSGSGRWSPPGGSTRRPARRSRREREDEGVPRRLRAGVAGARRRGHRGRRRAGRGVRRAPGRGAPAGDGRDGPGDPPRDPRRRRRSRPRRPPALPGAGVGGVVPAARGAAPHAGPACARRRLAPAPGGCRRGSSRCSGWWPKGSPTARSPSAW